MTSVARTYRIRFSTGPVEWEGGFGLGYDSGYAVVKLDEGRIVDVLDGRGVWSWSDTVLDAQLDLGEYGVENAEIKLEIDGDRLVSARASRIGWSVIWGEYPVPEWRTVNGRRVLVWPDGRVTMACDEAGCYAVDTHIDAL